MRRLAIVIGLLPLAASAQSWKQPAPANRMGDPPWKFRAVDSQREKSAYQVPMNAKLLKFFRQVPSIDPGTSGNELSWSYFDGSTVSRNDNAAFPLRPPGAACPSGGTWPNCAFAKGDEWDTLRQHDKLGTGQTGGAWRYLLNCRGPGDCFGMTIGMSTWNATPDAGDEGATALSIRTQDFPQRFPQGTIDADLTPGSTSMLTDLPWPEVAAEIGEWAVIVFTGSSDAVVIDNDDGAGVNVGGLEEYDFPTGTFTVNKASEIPAAMRRDSVVGHTGYCVGVEKGKVQDELANWHKKWFLVRSGPGDSGCGGTCASNQFEVYAPAENDPSQILNLVAGTIWIDWVTDSATDDAILAPCELAHYVEMDIDPTNGKPVATGPSWKIHLKNPSLKRTIPSGTAWESTPINYTYGYLPLGILSQARNVGGQAMSLAYPFCTQDPKSCQKWDAIYQGVSSRVRAAGTNGGTDRGVLADNHFRATGPVGLSAFSYEPGVNEVETAPMLRLSVMESDWGTGDADRIPVVRVRSTDGSSDNPRLTDLYDTVDLRRLVDRNGTITQQVEVKTDPIVYFVPAGSRDCSQVCADNKLVCDSWMSIASGGTLRSGGACTTDPSGLGGYCHCDSPET